MLLLFLRPNKPKRYSDVIVVFASGFCPKKGDVLLITHKTQVTPCASPKTKK